MKGKIKKLAAAGTLAVGMSLPAVIGIGAWAGPGGSGSELSSDVASGQSGEHADANDTDAAAELDTEDGQVSQVGENDEANESGVKETDSVNKGQSTANEQKGHTDANDQSTASEQEGHSDANDQNTANPASKQKWQSDSNEQNTPEPAANRGGEDRSGHNN